MTVAGHSTRVTRLYRQARRNLLDWVISREIFEIEAKKLRAQFDANRSATGVIAEKILKQGEQQLNEKRHPDPYKYIYMPGGTKFMRNHPPPAEILHRNIDVNFV